MKINHSAYLYVDDIEIVPLYRNWHKKGSSDERSQFKIVFNVLSVFLLFGHLIVDRLIFDGGRLCSSC